MIIFIIRTINFMVRSSLCLRLGISSSLLLSLTSSFILYLYKRKIYLET